MHKHGTLMLTDRYFHSKQECVPTPGSEEQRQRGNGSEAAAARP